MPKKKIVKKPLKKVINKPAPKPVKKIVAKKPEPKKKKNLEDAILITAKFLLQPPHKKFNALRLFQLLKQEGHTKNANELLEKLVDLEKSKVLFNVAGPWWTKL